MQMLQCKHRPGFIEDYGAGKNYQFKDVLQQQLQQCMTALMTVASPDDSKGRAFGLRQSLKMCVSDSDASSQHCVNIAN